MPTQRIITIFITLTLVVLNGCAAPTVAEPTAPTAEQLDRKQRSEQQLRAASVPVDELLPVIQAEANTTLRSKEEVANRVLCLIVVAGKADGLHENVIQTIVRRYRLEGHFSPWETQFVFGDGQPERDFTAAKWRYEAAVVLIWALGYTDILSRPDQMADVPKMIRLINNRNTQTFNADAKLRSTASILDSTDLVYRYHWAVFQAETAKQPSPANLLPGVVHERHHALNWLITFKGQDWDEVSTLPEEGEQESPLSARLSVNP